MTSLLLNLTLALAAFASGDCPEGKRCTNQEETD